MNVIQFKPSQSKSRSAAGNEDAAHALHCLAQAIKTMAEASFTTKSELVLALQLLKLSSERVRTLIEPVADPACRAALIARLHKIELLLETARDKAALL